MMERAIDMLRELDPASASAIDALAHERLRQIRAEGWTPEHDDAHGGGEMAKAASCYAYLSGTMAFAEDRKTGLATTASSFGVPGEWPWDDEWWKPKTAIRNLERAGALCVAEMARRYRRFPDEADLAKVSPNE